MNKDCQICVGEGWLCEQHPDLPFPHDKDCSGPGIPCRCNRGNYIPEVNFDIDKPLITND